MNNYIVYRQRVDTTGQTEAAALAAIYRFLLDQHAKKEDGVPSTAPNDVMKGSKDDSANTRLL